MIPLSDREQIGMSGCITGLVMSVWFHRMLRAGRVRARTGLFHNAVSWGKRTSWLTKILFRCFMIQKPTSSAKRRFGFLKELPSLASARLITLPCLKK